MNEAQPGLTPETIGSLVFMGTVTLLFVEHARHAWVDWRDLRTAHTLRVLIVALALASSLIALSLATLYRAGLIPIDVTVFGGYVVRGALLVAGIVDVVSWHLDRGQRRRETDHPA